MSSTPPRRGQKRPSPQTPRGQPPPKASRPSSPAEMTEQTFLGRSAPLTTGDLPAIPPFQPRAGPSGTRLPAQAEDDANDMEEDDLFGPGGETPPQEELTDLDTFTIPTVDEEIEGDEAASSFQEMKDWIRYVAQHKGQRQRLINFNAGVTTLLQDLMGPQEARKPSSYAAAAATSAPRPKFPKRATPAHTPKQIQHAITRFERASKELPGAPRDTLLKAVANSNLKTAPEPLPEAPKPRKKPACLVKGIIANTVAARLPPNAKVPPSLPAVITDVNAFLKKEKLDGRVKEIQFGIRRHLTVVFDKTVNDDTSKIALEAILGKFLTSREGCVLLERPTFSILKFTAVPTVSNDGRQITDDLAYSFLRKHPAWKDVVITEKPRFVFPKSNPDPPAATLQVRVKDTLKASVARTLLSTSVSFAGVTRRCQPWTVAPTARQCSTCLKWGHSAYVCRARSPQCDQCAGPHLTALHIQHVARCRDTECTHYDRKCANCNEQHNASSVTSPFFKARSSPGQLSKLQAERIK